MNNRSVVQVFFVVANRGGERVAAQLARGFRARGYDPISVGVYRSAAPGEDTADFVVLGDRRPGPLRVCVDWWRLVRLLRRQRPAAVILHTQVAGLLGATAAIVARVPARVIIHHINVGVSGRFFRPIEAVAGTIGLYTDIVFVGDAIRADIDHFPKRYRARARVIPNAVEAPAAVDREVVRAKYAIAHDAFVVFAAGALTDQKNHEVLVRALADTPDVLLMIAGDGPLRSTLEALAAELRTPVRFLGHVAPEAVLELYGAADLYVMPSRAEGRSLALLDAVAAGLPVLLSDIGQNIEVMCDAARYCPKGDMACWRACLLELARDPEALDALRSSCRAHDIGNVDDVVDAYIACIER